MNTLRFLHIPKTAGSTFNGILKHQYSGKNYFMFTGDPQIDIQNFSFLSDEQRSSIGLFMGHAPLISGIKEADQAIVITFLRDPVSRVKSFCQHVSEGKSSYLRKLFPPDSFCLDDFLNSGNEELSNLSTKMLVNSGFFASSNLVRKMSPTTARDKALENLTDKIKYFGIQERFDESLIHFADNLCWNLPFYISLNTMDKAKSIEFKTHHLEQIAALNSIDIEVYASAKSIFDDIIGSSRFNVRKLKRLKLVQRIMNPWMEAGFQVKKLMMPLFIGDKDENGLSS